MALNSSTSGAGVCCRTDATPTLAGCLIVSNFAAQDGGGICSFSTCQPVLTNCTIASNAATGNFGGGIFCADPNAVLNNSIIWGNAANTGNQIYSASGGLLVTLNYCCIPDATADPGRFAGPGGVDYSNNCIEADPLFADAGSGNYHLRVEPTPSPCINTGSDALVPPELTEDIERRSRFVGTVDMGAYENQ
jgi:hypothetical protein